MNPMPTNLRQAHGLLLGLAYGDGRYVVPTDHTVAPFWVLRADPKIDTVTKTSPALQAIAAFNMLGPSITVKQNFSGSWDVHGLPWEGTAKSPDNPNQYTMLVAPDLRWAWKGDDVSRGFFLAGTIQGEGSHAGLLLDDPHREHLLDFQAELAYKGIGSIIVADRLVVNRPDIAKLQELPFASYARVPV